MTQGFKEHQPVSIVVIGDVMIDYQYYIARFPQSGEDAAILSSRSTLGGSAANAALGLNFMGVTCAFVTKVGRDERGEWILRQLNAAGLGRVIAQPGQETGYTITFIDNSSERTMFSFRGCGAEPFELTPELESLLRETRLLLFSGYSLLQRDQAESMLRVAALCKRAGGMVVLDPSPMFGHLDPEVRQEVFALTDILMPNRSEAAILVGPGTIEEQLSRMVALVPCAVLKSGSLGAFALTQPGWKTFSSEILTGQTLSHAPALPVNAIDTTGAGDSFNAGFLSAFVKGETLKACLEAGNALAAKVVVVHGGSTLYLPETDTRKSD